MENYMIQKYFYVDYFVKTPSDILATFKVPKPH
jgi:hypothetical protein